MTPSSAAKSRSGYIPTLDGWRAIAVFSVIAFHGQVFNFGRFSDAFLHENGHFGVDLFFAISGILICSRLLEEEDLHGTISLKAFYIRRFCRILPPALLYLAVIGLLGLFQIVHVGLTAWICSLFFAGNYYVAHVHSMTVSPFTNHFWSLAVEEHFYLFLPGVLLFFPKMRTRILAVLIVLFVAYTGWICSTNAWQTVLGGRYYLVRTDMRMNGLLFPALLAILLTNARFRCFCTRWLHPLALLLVLGAAAFASKKAGLGLIDWLIVPFGFPFLIMSTFLRPKGVLSRLLEFAPLRFLGRISYSIYLWQQLFFSADAPAPSGMLGVLASWPWNLIATLALASASYYVIEKPFMRLGHRLAPPATPGRSDLADPSPVEAPQAVMAKS
jgi:peptidoglycan/LPS O-acetylase OafA/YrhL